MLILFFTFNNSIYFIIYSFHLIQIFQNFDYFGKDCWLFEETKKQSLFMWYSLDVARFLSRGIKGFLFLSKIVFILGCLFFIISFIKIQDIYVANILLKY